MDERVPINEEQLGHFIGQLARDIEAIKSSPKTEELFVGEMDGVRMGALLVKRTYRAEHGRLVPMTDDKQNPICLGDVPYAELSPPFVSPIIAGDESHAFKRMTDVIVQASAQAYGKNTTKTTVGLRFGKIEREIVVYGDRRGEFDLMGNPRFSEPEPFDSIPIRWDYAYGGFDKWGFKRKGIPFLDAIKPKPEWEIGSATPYHYPRNPAGCGFLLELDKETFTNLAIPNLEHPFAPLVPAAMAVGEVERWMRGPLPAAWDFQPLDWFPRCGYLGATPPYIDEGIPLAEVTRGYVAKDILSIPSFLKAKRHADYRLEFLQSAAPGLAVPLVSPDEQFVLTNVHPEEKSHWFSLPGELPSVLVELAPGNVVEADPKLVTVVIRVDLGEVECLWSARFPLPPELSEEDLLEARRVVQWKRPGKRG
ncbi:MAG: DUF2169 domain-containing protein [Polyangiaceae bacterium]|nr:DUF2169 domain-containing protein [Polyangiaceae bacterium]